jgi:hypothetical protein
VLDFLRKGDVLMVTRIDRLARSIADLQDIVRTIRERGAALKATEQPIDTSTAAGKWSRLSHGDGVDFTARAGGYSGYQGGPERPHSAAEAPLGARRRR